MDRARVRAHFEQQRRIKRNIGAIVAAYLGVLLAVAASLHVGYFAGYVLMFGAGAVATVLLGNLLVTLAAPPRVVHVGWGLAGACATLAISFAYALALGLRPDWEWQTPAPAVVLALAILPALLEEWLCRGVLWAACRRLTTTGNTIVITAVLFGLMHVLSWGPFGFPSRALGGLVLGLLRARTNSLAPCLLAHLLNNIVAVGVS